MKLYHVADLHLGRNRLDGRLPDGDLASAFRWIAEAAVADGADAFLLAGDLFDRPQVEPDHLRQAQGVLRILRDAGIPVLAIEGNHDKASIHQHDDTWVRFLAQEGLLHLLRPAFGPEGATLTPYDTKTHTGSYLDLKGVRFVGAGYLGAATPAKLRQIVAALDESQPHVLLLHAGPDYFVGEGGGFAKEDLEALRHKLRYLALGHIHKPMVHGRWACNPGSPENCDLREAAYSQPKDGNPAHRGYAVVTFDPAVPGDPGVEIRSNPRRPVETVELDCTLFGSEPGKANASLVAAARQAIAALKPAPETVIDLRLTGRLALGRAALDLDRAAEAIAKAAGVFLVWPDLAQLNPGQDAAGGAQAAPELTREELERNAIRDGVRDSSRLGLAGEDENFVELFYRLKEMVRAGKDGEALAEVIGTNPLVGKIHEAKIKAETQEALPPGEARS